MFFNSNRPSTFRESLALRNTSVSQSSGMGGSDAGLAEVKMKITGLSVLIIGLDGLEEES